jgi:hypothetical protein
MSPIITLPADFVTSSMAYIGQLFTDMTPAIILVIGLPLAFWAVAKVIALVRGGFRTGRRGY